MTRIAIIAHTTRAHTAARLQRHIGGIILLDDGTLGAYGNHRRALEYAADHPGRTWILEDDAWPVPRFHELAALWHARHPDRLISGYLGTHYPPAWQRRADEEIAHHPDRDWIELPQLIHAVCYSLTGPTARRILTHLRPGAADTAIGGAHTRGGGAPIIYPLASLAEHTDPTPVEHHPDGIPRTLPRHARQLAT